MTAAHRILRLHRCRVEEAAACRRRCRRWPPARLVIVSAAAPGLCAARLSPASMSPTAIAVGRRGERREE